MATLIELCGSDKLRRIDVLEEDEQDMRILYATPPFIDWMDNKLPEMPLEEIYSDMTPEEQLFAAFAEYASGDDFSSDRRFKKLKYNPDYHVWEIKTDALRVFGWIPCKAVFICCFGEDATHIKRSNLYLSYILQTQFVRNNLDLDPPKFLTSGDYADVL